jgi:vacuolar-type H+-ATPase subunit I/STV1
MEAEEKLKKGGMKMYYFRFLALVFGVLLVTFAPCMFILEKRWRRFVLETLYPPLQPLWIWAAAAVSVFIVVITWYMELTTRVSFSWLLTFFVTLSIPKMYFLLFRYAETRRKLLPFIENERLFPLVSALTSWCMGLVILALGVFSL